MIMQPMICKDKALAGKMWQTVTRLIMIMSLCWIPLRWYWVQAALCRTISSLTFSVPLWSNFDLQCPPIPGSSVVGLQEVFLVQLFCLLFFCSCIPAYTAWCTIWKFMRLLLNHLRMFFGVYEPSCFWYASVFASETVETRQKGETVSIQTHKRTECKIQRKTQNRANPN